MIPPGLIIGILAAWFVVSAIVQIRLPATRRLRRFDPFGLLPRWNLFSPRPIQTDLIVRYRRWDPATGPCDWVALPYPGTRKAGDAIFSRRRRSKRTVYNQAERVVTIYRTYHAEPAKVIGSIPYRHLLARATREAREAEGDRRPVPGGPRSPGRRVRRASPRCSDPPSTPSRSVVRADGSLRRRRPRPDRTHREPRRGARRGRAVRHARRTAPGRRARLALPVPADRDELVRARPSGATPSRVSSAIRACSGSGSSG